MKLSEVRKKMPVWISTDNVGIMTGKPISIAGTVKSTNPISKNVLVDVIQINNTYKTHLVHVSKLRKREIHK